jgi:hypothetical protein
MEYQIQPHTRHCSVTGQEIRPGEKFFTVLLEENHQFLRRDYSAEAWQGAPAGAFSTWVGRMPENLESRRPPIDDEILLDCFHRLEGQTEPHKINFRYVVALLLMRRKRLRFEDARQQQGQEVLLVRGPRDRKTCEVINPRLTDEEIAAVQEEVFKVLGWE